MDWENIFANYIFDKGLTPRKQKRISTMQQQKHQTATLKISKAHEQKFFLM